MTTIDQARVEQPVSSRGAKRGWAAAGVLAGGSAVASIQLSTMASPVYDAATPPTAAWVAEQLSTKVPVLIGFHLTTNIQL